MAEACLPSVPQSVPQSQAGLSCAAVTKILAGSVAALKADTKPGIRSQKPVCLPFDTFRLRLS